MALGLAMQTYGEALAQEQEVLMLVSDILMHTFIGESAVLRANQGQPAGVQTALHDDAAAVLVTTRPSRGGPRARRARGDDVGRHSANDAGGVAADPEDRAGEHHRGPAATLGRGRRRSRVSVPMTHTHRFVQLVVSITAIVVIGGAACSSGPRPIGQSPYAAVCWRIARARTTRSGRPTDPSPLKIEERAAFPVLAFFPIDPVVSRARVIAHALRVGQSAGLTSEVLDVGGIEKKRRGSGEDRLARLCDQRHAKYAVRLRLTKRQGGLERLFVPFGDLTNNGENVRAAGATWESTEPSLGLYDLDFNRASPPVLRVQHELRLPDSAAREPPPHRDSRG